MKKSKTNKGATILLGIIDYSCSSGTESNKVECSLWNPTGNQGNAVQQQ